MGSFIRESDYENIEFDANALWAELQKRAGQVANDAMQVPGINLAAQGLGNALELAGRPISGIASGVEAARTQGDVLGAIGSGLRGESEVRGFGDVLRNAGVEEGPALDIGPLHVSARDAAGFGADMLFDPTTYVGGILGKGLGAVGKGAQVVDPALSTKALGVAEDIPTKGIPQLPKQPTYDEMYTQLYSGNAPMRKAASLPILNRVAKYFSPTMVADDGSDAIAARRALDTLTAMEEDADRLVGTSMASLHSRDLPFTLTPDKQKFVLPDGREMPTNDVISDPYRYMPTPEEAARTHALTYTPEQQAWLDEVRALAKARSEYEAQHGVRMGTARAPEGATEGWQQVPRRTLDKPNPFDVPLYRRSIGKIQPGQKRRGFATQTEGMVEGWEYADPLTALEQSIAETYRAVIQNQARYALRPLAKVRDEARLNALREPINEIRVMQGANKEVQSIISRAQRGENIPAGTMKHLLKDDGQVRNRSIVQALDNIIQIKPAEVLIDAIRNLRFRNGSIATGIVGDLNDERLISEIAEFARLNPNLTFDTVMPNLQDAIKATTTDEKAALRMANQIYKESVMEAFKRSKDAKREGLAGLSKQLRDENAVLRESRLQARDLLNAAKQEENAKLVGLDKAKGQPALAGLRFEPEVTKAIADKIRVDTGNWGWLAKKSGDIRKVQASFDLSAPMLQGLPVLLTNPSAWAKGFTRQISALKDIKYINQYMVENKDIIDKLPGLIVGSGSNEFFEAGPFGIKQMENLARRSQAAYDTFGTVARVEMAKALIPLYEKHGRPLSELADYLNKMTGVISTKAMGVSARQRAVESSLLFFAPRYIRATAALIGDAFMGGNGLEAWQARQALASMLVAGTATYMKASEALGQEAVLDPADSRFLTVQVGNDRVGIGSAWIAIMRLIARSTADPEGLTKWMPQEWGDNPILTWMRSRMAPAGSIAADIAAGQTYSGEKIDSTESFLLYAATRLMPFALENAVTPMLAEDIGKVTGRPIDSAQPMGAGAQALGLLGLRNFPQNFKERRESEARTYAKEQGLPYTQFADFAPEQQQDISERMNKLGFRVRSEDLERKNALYAEHARALDSYANMVASGDLSKAQYREVRNKQKAALSAKLEEVNVRMNQGKTPEQIEQAFQERVKTLQPRDAARETYYHTLYQKDALGEPSWEAAESYLSTLPKEYQDYIDQTSEARLRNLPAAAQSIEREYREARNLLGPYWDIQDKIMKRYGWTEKIKGASPAQIEKLKKTPLYGKIEKEVSEQRKALRRRDRKLDEALSTWYGYTPIREQGQSNSLFAEFDFQLPSMKSNPLSGFLD